MHDRQIFSNDVQYFPTPRVREIIKHLHDNQQQYIVMVDPAVSVRENPENGAYFRGREADIFVKDADGTDFRGVVWPGVTVYPDWFHKRTQSYWTNEFKNFFDAKSGWVSFLHHDGTPSPSLTVSLTGHRWPLDRYERGG